MGGAADFLGGDDDRSIFTIGPVTFCVCCRLQRQVVPREVDVALCFEYGSPCSLPRSGRSSAGSCRSRASSILEPFIAVRGVGDRASSDEKNPYFLLLRSRSSPRPRWQMWNWTKMRRPGLLRARCVWGENDATWPQWLRNEHGVLWMRIFTESSTRTEEGCGCWTTEDLLGSCSCWKRNLGLARLDPVFPRGQRPGTAMHPQVTMS